MASWRPRLRPQHGLILTVVASTLLLLLVTAAALVGFAQTSGAMREMRQLTLAHELLQGADTEHDALRGDVYEAFITTTGGGLESAPVVQRQMNDDRRRLEGTLRALVAVPLTGPLAAEVAGYVDRLSGYADLATGLSQEIFLNPGAGKQRLDRFEATFDAIEAPQDRLLDAVSKRADRSAATAARTTHEATQRVVVAAALALAGMLGLGVMLVRSGRGQVVVMRTLRRETDRQRFGAQLGTALDMADAERGALEVAAQAMLEIAPDRPMQLLLADSSQAHIESVAEHPSAGSPGCGVDSPWSCPAVRRGALLRMDSGRALDACPKLRERQEGKLSATCAPVMFMGRALGVVHVTGPENRPLAEAQSDRAATLAGQLGTRIGTLRAFATSQLQAETDTLTGLCNRRSLEDRVYRLVAAGRRFSLALADLDHFKQVNDRHGHAAGDRALRTFANVTRTHVRAEDVVARYGGEEFVLVFPDLDLSRAAAALDRHRTALAEAVKAGGEVRFTASYGLTHSDVGRSLDEILRVADAALLEAKAAGRDRVVIAGPDGIAEADDLPSLIPAQAGP